MEGRQGPPMISSVPAIPQFGALSSAPQLKIKRCDKTSANRPGLITSMFIERIGISWWRCAAWVEHPTCSRSELSSKAATPRVARPEAAAPRQSPRSAHCCGASGFPRRVRPTSPSGWSHWRPTTELGCCRARYLAHAGAADQDIRRRVPRGVVVSRATKEHIVAVVPRTRYAPRRSSPRSRRHRRDR